MKQIENGKEEKTNIKFYQTVWFTTFMLMFFAPVGIFLIWKNGFMSKTGRIIVTTIFTPVIFVGLMFWIGVIVSDDSSLSKVSDKQVSVRNEKANVISDNKSETESDKNKLYGETQLLELIETDTKDMCKLYNNCCEFASNGDGFDLQSINQLRERMEQKEKDILSNTTKLQNMVDKKNYDLYYDMLSSSCNISQYVVSLTDMMIKDYKQGLIGEESRLVDDMKGKLDIEVSNYSKKVNSIIRDLEQNRI